MRKIDLDSPEVWQSRVNLATCFRAAARLGLDERVCNHLSSLVFVPKLNESLESVSGGGLKPLNLL